MLHCPKDKPVLVEGTCTLAADSVAGKCLEFKKKKKMLELFQSVWIYEQ